jgi:acylphosphatase
MADTEMASVRAMVYGRVQGVFFRSFVRQQAKRLNITGYVRNLPGGDCVEVVAEGPGDNLEILVNYLETGPPTARVERVALTLEQYSGTYSDFSIRY